MITGIVIRKMISNTSITSTSGVVLMADRTSSSSPPAGPTFIAMIYAFAGDLRSAQQDRVQVGAEAADALHGRLVAADQPVVAKHRRHRDRKTDGRHDQRFADGTRDLVDRGLTGDTDRGQRVVDPPDRSEQPHERCRRADGGEKREPILGAALHVFDRALDRHRDPFVQVDAAQQSGVLVGSFEAGLRNESIGAALLQVFRTLADRRRAPEGLVRGTRLLAHLVLLIHLGDDDVPAAHGHDHQNDQRGLGDEVAALPQRLEAVGIVDDLGAAGRARGGRRCGRGRRGCRRPARRPVQRERRASRPARVAAAPATFAGQASGYVASSKHGQCGHSGHVQHDVSRQKIVQSVSGRTVRYVRTTRQQWPVPRVARRGHYWMRVRFSDNCSFAPMNSVTPDTDRPQQHACSG